jgi:putative ABC transport system ATP-binding protein
MTQLLSARGVRKTYGSRGMEFPALNGVDLDIAAGEFVGIMGPSGSGKTTLLNLLSTIDRPSAGAIRFEGRALSELSARELANFRRDRLGFIFQDFNLLDTLTLFENVILPLALAGKPSRLQAEAGRRTAAALGLTGILDKYPWEVSGGQKQRAAAARALVADPALILADEPTGNLDSRSAGELLSSLRGLNETQGATILMVTHDAYAASFCGRIVLLKDGLVFGEIRRGPAGGGAPDAEERRRFFDRIIDSLRKLEGGGNADC